MRLAMKVASSIVGHQIIIFLAPFASILGFVMQFFDMQPFSSNILSIISLLILPIIVLAAAFIHRDNKTLKDATKHFREINSIYKESLHKVFFDESSYNTEPKRIEVEKSTVTAVCQRIANVFTELTREDCVVTVKLLTKEDNNIFAETYARSQNFSRRDNYEPKKFAVNTGQNTAFDFALMSNFTGNISHFYSPDLTKHQDYCNERPNWDKHYKSAIVVPINCLVLSGESKRIDIGFLCVDTMSRNTLNNTYNLAMLVSLADQMYNFMSLMRNEYRKSK